MIFSDNQLFSYQQNVAGSDVDSENVIDLGDTGDPGAKNGILFPHDVGKGNPVEFVAQVTGVTTAADLTVNVITGSSVDGSGVIQNPTTLASSTITNVEDGAQSHVRFIPTGAERYIGLNYGTTGDVTVVAGINLGTQTNG